MSPQESDSRPARNGPATKSLNTTNNGSDCTANTDNYNADDTATLFILNEHGALIAADAAQGWKRHAVESAVRAAAARGETFAADDIERECGVLCDANWVGGIYMRLRREGVIRKAGYRPSTKTSRAGSVVTLWTAGDHL